MISAGIVLAIMALQAAGPQRAYTAGQELRYRTVQTESHGGTETVLTGESLHRTVAR